MTPPLSLRTRQEEPILGTVADPCGEEIMFAPEKLARANHAIPVNLTNRDKPVTVE